MPDRSRKRPRDPNQLAKFIVDAATGARNDEVQQPEYTKNPAAVELGRLGGAKGGIARAASLTPEDRRRIAAEAAKARWGKKSTDKT